MPVWVWWIISVALELLWPLLQKLLPWLPSNLLDIIKQIIELLKRQKGELKGLKAGHKAERRAVWHGSSGVAIPSDVVQ